MSAPDPWAHNLVARQCGKRSLLGRSHCYGSLCAGGWAGTDHRDPVASAQDRPLFWSRGQEAVCPPGLRPVPGEGCCDSSQPIQFGGLGARRSGARRAADEVGSSTRNMSVVPPASVATATEAGGGCSAVLTARDARDRTTQMSPLTTTPKRMMLPGPGDAYRGSGGIKGRGGYSSDD